VVDLAVLGLQLDSMILKIFSNLYDSVTTFSCFEGNGRDVLPLVRGKEGS